MTWVADDRMNDVDVVIRCDDGATDIVAAVRSVLRQTEIDCRVWLIEDTRTDDPMAQVKSIADPRLTVLEHRSVLGEAASLNMLLARSHSPYVVVMSGDGTVLPGGLARLVEALARTPRCGQVHGAAFFVDQDRQVTRGQVADAARRHGERCKRSGGSGFLLAFGETLGPVAYRRAALEAIGGFDAQLASEAQLDGAFRISATYDTKILAELVCAVRRERRRASTSVWRRLALYRRAVRGRTGWRTVLDAGLAMFETFGRERIRAVAEIARAARVYLVWSVAMPLWSRLYDHALLHCANWPIALFPGGRTGRRPAKRIAYFLWRYPVSSQTFIQRELTALEATGIDLHVIAEGGDGDLCRVRRTEYLHPIRPSATVRDVITFALRRPFRLANLVTYVLFRTYRPPKSLAEDAQVFVL